MSKNNMENFKKFMSGRGYYIALILCAVAIGISGYMYYRTANKTETPAGPDVSVAATLPNEELPSIAQPTQPALTTPKETTPAQLTPAPTQGQGSKPSKTVSPLQGQTVMAYAMDCLAYNPTTRDWRVHNGVDIAAEAGTKVCAAAAGEVYTVYKDDTMGYTVVISHSGGYKTCYASLSEDVAVKVGDKVTAGQTIGTVGNSALLESAIGDHLHFAVTCNGEEVDPADFVN